MTKKTLEDHSLEWVRNPIRSGRMSRRDFMAIAISAGVATSVAQALYVKEAKAEPKQGGSFRAGLADGASTDSLDPTTWGANSFSSEFSTLSTDTLIALDNNNNFEPRLAEAFSSEDGASTWIFKIRKGVTFKNGKTLTPEDVIASYNIHLGEDSKSLAKSSLETIESMTADGDNVIFKLKSGNADFPFVTASYRMGIYPAKSGGGLDWESGGCGAFHISEFEPGVRIRAERNPDFWDAKNVYFDDVELLVVADSAARTNALLTDEVQYIDRVDLKTVDMLKANSNIEVDNVTGYAHLVANMLVDRAPFNDPNVRLAMKYAINREELVEKVLFGYGKPGNDNPILPSVKYGIDPQPRHSYNPEKAREYLKKAGLDSLKVDLHTSEAAFGGAIDAAQLMKESAAAAGIEINIVTDPADSYWDVVWKQQPFMLSYWSGSPSIDYFLTLVHAADADYNDTFWKHPRFNELLSLARSETDETKRAAMYAEMQQLLHDDGGQILLAFNNDLSAHSKAIAHGALSNVDHDNTYMWRRWWRA